MRILLISLVVVGLFGAGCGTERSDGARAASSRDDSSLPSTSGPASSDEGDVDPIPPSPSSSTDAVATTSTVLVVPDPETTDTTPVTTLPATVGLPDEGEERLNEGGVPITLDETAALACANAEFARDSIEFADFEQAERDVSAAADRAEPSEQPAIAEAADLIRGAMDGSDPVVVVEAFLDICVEHGHQI